MITAETVTIGATLAALEMIRGGVTTVADMYYFETEVGRIIDAAGMRGVVGQTIADGRGAYTTPGAQVAILVALGIIGACWLWAGRLMKLPEEERVFYEDRS